MNAQVVKLLTRYIFSIAFLALIHFQGLAQDSLYVEMIENIKPRQDTLMVVPQLDSIRLGFNLPYTQAELDSLTKLYSDQQKGQSTKQRRDSLNIFRSGIQFYVDYGKLLTYFSQYESKLEGGAGVVVLKRFLFNAEYGTAVLEPAETFKNVSEYKAEGDYYRLGLDYIFALNENNFLNLGARYAMCNYSDEGVFLIGSELWEEYQGAFGSNNLQATWGEIVMTSETRLSDRFFLGIKARLRLLIDSDERQDIPVYAIPGYGRYFDKSIPALNFHLKYKIDF